MTRAREDIEKDIRALSTEDKTELLRHLLAELDSPPDPQVERAWLEASQRRYRELVDGKVKGVPAHLVFERLHA